LRDGVARAVGQTVAEAVHEVIYRRKHEPERATLPPTARRPHPPATRGTGMDAG
jgi:hypothetical protein